MPDVGTLNIEITSNAEEAARGLGTLATKLGSVKKNADGFDLSNVKTNITNIVNAVKGSEKTMASLGTLFNATASYFKAFGKITDKININTKPIKDLKEAFGEGIKTGNVGSQLNQLRTALEGEWRTDNAYSAGQALSAISAGAKDAESVNLASVAKGINEVAKAMSDYAFAAERIKDVAGVENIKEAFETLAGYASEGMAQGFKEGEATVSRASSEMTKAGIESAADTQQSHSPSEVYKELGAYAGEGYAEGIRSKMSAVTAIVAEMVQSAIASSEGKTAKVAEAVANAVKTAFSSALAGMDISEVQKSLIQRTADLTADVVKAMATTSKADLGQTGKIAADTITSAMSGAVDKALDVVKPLQEGMQQVNAELQTAGTTVENSIDQGIKETVSATAEMNERLQMTNEELQEQLRIRKEIMDAQNQARLENNYPLYRELYMSGEGDWKQQVPEMYGFTEKAIENNENYADALKETLQEVNTYVDQFIEKTNTPAGNLLRDVIDQTFEAKLSFKDASESAATLKKAPEPQVITSGMEQVNEATQTVGSAMERTKSATRVLTDDMKDLDKELKRKKPDAETATKGINKFGFSLKDLKKGIKSAFPLLAQLSSRLKSIIIRRTLTAAIRKVVSSAKEGIQNVYEYSKLIGSGFSSSMDGAASSLAQMKNALGAQLAPLLQMLIPVLQRVVNWFINVLNVANQFFSLLNGQKSWTRALPQTVSAFDKQKKAAKSASAAMKDLLADWDELNIIQSESGGGGGAGTTAAEDYLKMFEEVYTFDNKIKDTVQWVQDHMEEIKTVAEAIGLSILGWKISEAFGLTLGTLQKLELIGGIILTIASIKLLASAAYDIGKNGINGQNALDAVADVLGTMVGTAVAGFAIGGVVGAAIGLIVGAAISLAVTGINIREGKLDSLYGDVSKDVDDIRKELEKNVLTADATMTVNVAQAKIKDVQDAETKVTNAINELNKTYPLGVEITPTNANDFIGKVNALVAADNELLQKSEEVLKLTVPASPKWTNEGDFHTFLNEALGDVSSYVTGIGEEIGKLISQGITKGTKLDELRKQLEEISVAILTAQKSSEFSAAVGIAGATARNMKQYDRKTIENYMTEYATLLQGKMGEAQAQATAEYVELQRTVAAYEELGKNNAEEYDPEVMKQLREELAAWDNGKRVNVRAQELVDEWTAVGRELYKNDILSLLSGNMIKNKNTGWRYSALYGSGSMSQEPINIINSYDDKRKREWADEYIEQGNKILKDIIQSETGINGDVVLNFANESGLSLLDFFDAGFAKEFEDSILKVVSQIDIPQNEKERIYAAFGMDYNNYNVPKEIEEAIVKYSEGGLDTREINQILEHFDITNERLNRYIQILGYENLFGEHYYTERDDTGYLNPDEAEKAMRFIASAGSVSDVGWGQYYPVAQPEQEELTEVDFARAVETGTTNANVNQNMLFEQMISLLGQIAGKDFTVNITPTSTAGAFVNRSIAKFNMIAHD